MPIYTPFGYSEWRAIVEKIKAFGSEGKKTAVISTVSGDANTHFYRELADQRVDANAIPVMALSIGERELLGADIFLVGHLAARNYFHSVKSPENEAFIKMWADFNGQHDKTTNYRLSHLHWLQDVGASRCPGGHHRRQRGPAGHVRSEDQRRRVASRL